MGVDRVTPGTVAVVLDKENNLVLLHLRNDKPMWSLPGGPPDFGESFSSAVVRETAEETGYKIEIIRLIGVYSKSEYWIFDYPDGNRAHAFAAAFECVVLGGEARPNMEDSLEVRWFPLGELPENTMPMHPKVIEDCINGKSGVIS